MSSSNINLNCPLPPACLCPASPECRLLIGQPGPILSSDWSTSALHPCAFENRKLALERYIFCLTKRSVLSTFLNSSHALVAVSHLPGQFLLFLAPTGALVVKMLSVCDIIQKKMSSSSILKSPGGF